MRAIAKQKAPENLFSRSFFYAIIGRFDDDRHGAKRNGGCHQRCARKYTRGVLSTSTPEPAVPETFVYIEKAATNIINAKKGTNITLDHPGINSYSEDFMQTIADRRDIDITMKYTYKGKKYTIVIPKGAKVTLDPAIKWYGPLKLAEMFGATIE